jgi:hypothetical protein
VRRRQAAGRAGCHPVRCRTAPAWRPQSPWERCTPWGWRQVSARARSAAPAWNGVGGEGEDGGGEEGALPPCSCAAAALAAALAGGAGAGSGGGGQQRCLDRHPLGLRVGRSCSHRREARTGYCPRHCACESICSCSCRWCPRKSSKAVPATPTAALCATAALRAPTLRAPPRARHRARARQRVISPACSSADLPQSVGGRGARVWACRVGQVRASPLELHAHRLARVDMPPAPAAHRRPLTAHTIAAPSAPPSSTAPQACAPRTR